LSVGAGKTLLPQVGAGNSDGRFGAGKPEKGGTAGPAMERHSVVEIKFQKWGRTKGGKKIRNSSSECKEGRRGQRGGRDRLKGIRGSKSAHQGGWWRKRMSLKGSMRRKKGRERFRSGMDISPKKGDTETGAGRPWVGGKKRTPPAKSQAIQQGGKRPQAKIKKTDLPSHLRTGRGKKSTFRKKEGGGTGRSWSRRGGASFRGKEDPGPGAPNVLLRIERD